MALDPLAPVSVLGISSSPRKMSNSELLLKQVLAGAEEEGARTELVSLREVLMRPCQACRSCEKTGECIQRDDFQGLRDRMVAADRVVVATPVYWMTVSAQLKLLLDRCQSLWARKHRLKRPLPPPANPPRIGAAIAVGGSEVGEMFFGIRLTMRHFFDVLSVAQVHELYYHPYDQAGAIREHPTALQDALRLGQLIGGRSWDEEVVGACFKPARTKEEAMKKYECQICGYIYDPAAGDPDNGVKPGTPFEKLPDDWTCPQCGAEKDQFEPLD